MKYRHLFFDLDHTLWDFETNSRKVLNILFNEFRLNEKSIPDAFTFQMHFERHNEKFWERYRKGQINREELRLKRFWHTLLDFKIKDYDLAETISHTYLNLLLEQSRLMPYTKEILNYCLEKGYHLHLITNGFESVQKTKLKNSGIDGYFQSITTSQNCGYLKPQPEIFEFALKVASAAIPESLMIGDALEADILGAQNIGIDQVFFNSRKIDHAEKPTYEITELKSLKKIL